MITLPLRAGVTFHNGDPLTADDVQFNFETWQTQTGGQSDRLAFSLRPALAPHRFKP